MKFILLNIKNMQEFKPLSKNKGAILLMKHPSDLDDNHIWYDFALEKQNDLFIDYYKEKLGFGGSVAEHLIARWNSQDWDEVEFLDTFKIGQKSFGIFKEPNSNRLICMANYGIVPEDSDIISVPHYSWVFLDETTIPKKLQLSDHEYDIFKQHAAEVKKGYEPVILEIN